MNSNAPSLTCVCPSTANGANPWSRLTLMDLPINTPARIRGLRARLQGENTEFAMRLLEIGFIAGEQVHVVAHGYPGREPVAVRIGGTTFALRRFEAELVLVEMVNHMEAGV